MSTRRKNAKSDKPARTPFVARPFEGLPNETDWVALREVVPSATAPLSLKDGTAVTLGTILPRAYPGLVTLTGLRYLGLQVGSRSGDASRDLAVVLEEVVTAADGTFIQPVDLPEPGPRLQDLLTDTPLEITIHDGFDWWLEGFEDTDGEMAAQMEAANASVVPTVKLSGVQSGYWCKMRERAHLRWILPEQEDQMLDALARVSVGGGLSLGEGTRFVGSFRAHGLLVPVWDLPLDMDAEALEAPTAALRVRLDEALTETGLTSEARRARQGLMNRQLTLR